MRRYRFLRSHGCSVVISGFIAIMNWAIDYPPNLIGFMNVVIEMENQP